MAQKKVTLTVALAVFNEAANISRCLDSVRGLASEIVVIDGGSTDGTVALAKKYTQHVVSTDNPPIFHINKQKALDKAKGDWILQLDADEVVDENLLREIMEIISSKDARDGYYIPRRNYFLGNWLRKGGQYPDYVIRLFRNGKGKFPCKSVHEQIEISGLVGHLKNPLDHYSYTSIPQYWKKSESYIRLTADEMRDTRRASFGMYVFLKPFTTFFALFARHKGFLDGWRGFLFALFSALHFPKAFLISNKKTIDTMTPYLPHASVVVLCIVLFISHTLYVLKTYQYPQGGLDEPVYMQAALDMYDLIRDGKISDVFTVIVDRQPLYPFFLALPLLVFGTVHFYTIALWLNIIFYLITVLSIFYLGRIYMSKWSSFMAATLFATYGFPLFYLHFAYSETATTAFTTLSLYFLAKLNKSYSIRNSLYFSLFFTVSSLTRWVAPLFIIGPFLQKALGMLISKSYKNIIYFSIVFILIGILPSLLMYYIPNKEFFLGYIRSNQTHGARWALESLGITASQGVFSVRSVMYYLNILSQQGIYFWLLFVFGFIVSIRYIRRYLFILLGFVVPYAIFTFSTVWKGDRFIVPIYPFMALISAVSFDHMKKGVVRSGVMVITLLLCVLNLLGASWGIGPLGKQGLKDIVLPEFIHHPRRIYLTSMVWPPRPNEGNVPKLVSILRNDWGSRKGEFVHTLMFYMPQIDNALYQVFDLEQRGISRGTVLYPYHKGQIDEFLHNVLQADYILTKSGDVDDHYLEKDNADSNGFGYYVRQFRDRMNLPAAHMPKGYDIVGSMYVPFDGSTLTVYRKNRPVTENEWRELMGE